MDEPINNAAYEPLISIIIPVYHVEPYIEKCLNSVLTQSYSNYEAIIVNDGGTSIERDICRAYCDKDPRFLLIDTENRGISSTRNTGLDRAHGKIIVFLDSDDYLLQNHLMSIVSTFSETSADIVQFDFYVTDESGSYTLRINSDISYGLHSSKEMILSLATGKMWPNLWARAFRVSVFEDIRFPDGELWEDAAILHELFFKAENVYYINQANYYYLQRSTGITKCDPLNPSRWRFIQYRKRYDFISSKYPESVHNADISLIRTGIGYGKWCVLTHRVKEYDEMRAWFLSKQMYTKGLPVLLKAAFWILIHCKPVFPVLVKVYELFKRMKTR